MFEKCPFALQKQSNVIIEHSLHPILPLLLMDNRQKSHKSKNNAWSSPLNSHDFTVCHTISLPFSRSHGGFFISHGFANFKRIFSQTHSFLRKQTKAAHSNAAEERISSMINKNKRSSRRSLSLSWALLLIVFVKAHIDSPFQ